MAKLTEFFKRNRNFLLLLLVSLLFLLLGNYITTVNNPFFAGSTRAETYYRAKVLSVSEPTHVLEQYEGWAMEYDSVDIEIHLLEGAMRGRDVTVHHRLTGDVPYKTYPYKAGNRILVSFNFDATGEVIWYIADHLRERYLLGLVLLFLGLLVAFGRAKGARTVVSLVYTISAIFFVMLPGIIKGLNIYVITLAVSTYIIFMTLGILSGINTKSIAAAVGCFSGVALAGIITVVMQNIMKITGLIDEDSSFVMYINTQTPIDLQGVIFAAIVIGALGATMDVAMSIASSLDELLYHRPDLPNRELVASGLNIGRDIMGTMSNTLILAYVGSSLHVILLLLAYNLSVGNIINREQVAVEILQAVAGSLGILFAVPATTFVTAAMRDRFARARREETVKDGP